MKKTVCICLALIILFCIISFGPAAIFAQAASKISSDLHAAFQDTEGTGKAMAFVEMVDVDHTAVMQEFERIYPEYYAVYLTAKKSELTDSVDGELLQKAIEKKREVYVSVYKQKNSDIINQVFSEDEQVYVCNYAPVAIIETNKSSAYRLARNSSIVSISLLEDTRMYDLSDGEIKTGLTYEEVMGNIERVNGLSRADVVRDTYNMSGSNVKIGVLEVAGVPNITNPYLSNANIIIRTGYSAPSSDHATVVASILVASTDEKDYGIVPDATLYCANSAYTSDWISHLEWMIANGVNIINVSAGSKYPDGNYDLLSQWFDHIAVLHDVHVVVAAGNNENGTHFIGFPAMAYNAITVGNYNGDFIVWDSSYIESEEGGRPEKPNLVACGHMGDFRDENGRPVAYSGTSFSAPQVTGVIAQLCCWSSSLKTKQSVVGAILAASAARKIEAVGDGTTGDDFLNPITGSSQISNKEGAGVLDACWAWGIVANDHYWSVKPTGFPYEKTITINTAVNSISRVAIFWLKRNSSVSCTDGTVGSNPDLPNLDLYIYDSEGNLIASSTTLYSNFEIVQFIPEGTGEYIIRITGSTGLMEHVGIALW